jgi:hypothetical protein
MVYMENLLFQSLSPQQLADLWNSRVPNAGNIRVIDYNHIINSSNIEEVFGNHDKVVVFYPNSKNANGDEYGHYCVLIKHPSTIYFFDSYGNLPDTKQKEFAGSQRNQLYRENSNSLINHVLNSNYKLDYNAEPLQNENPKIATCGRWSLLRCAFADMTNDDFAKYILKECRKHKISPDYLTVKVFH